MEKQSTSNDTKVSYVYAMSTNTLSEIGIYKVGVTSNLERRRKQLSDSTASFEEFFIVHFVRCRTRNEANRLEVWVKKALDAERSRYRRRREFYKVGTAIPLWGCFREGAATLGIEIAENISCDPEEILKEQSGCILDKRNIAVLSETIQKYYLKGASDMAAFYMEMASLTNDLSFACTIYRKLSDFEQPAGQPKDLYEIVYEALLSNGYNEIADKLLNLLKSDVDDEEIFDWRGMVDRR